ncbi:PAS domain-containing protein [Sphingomonas sp.]|uniref:PAS domain-containing protein n=1 Tax=Sphingomonas sp. TaxID=28214 RepID=UPI002869FAFF|nr:PAS domain-containing protein [Sphingomonas sp.]
MSPRTAQTLLNTAVDAIASGNGWRVALDALPVPVYTTDAEGLVTYWNRACVAFAGREPTLGEDRWCVTWRIHTPADEHLPHDKCPMAVAIKERRPVRGEVAIAMRPDGTRKAFTPYPTPLFDAAGILTGAVNLLIDVSAEQAAALDEQVARCHRLSAGLTDRRTAHMLDTLADGFERNAVAVRA